MQRYKKKFELQSLINSFCCRFNNLWDKLGVIGGRGRARKTRISRESRRTRETI